MDILVYGLKFDNGQGNWLHIQYLPGDEPRRCPKLSSVFLALQVCHSDAEKLARHVADSGAPPF